MYPEIVNSFFPTDATNCNGLYITKVNIIYCQYFVLKKYQKNEQHIIFYYNNVLTILSVIVMKGYKINESYILSIG